MRKYLLIGGWLIGLQAIAQQSLIFPQPHSLEQTLGSLQLDHRIRYVSSPEADAALVIVHEQFERLHGLEFRAVPSGEPQDLHFRRESALLPESYSLDIDPSGISIAYNDASGLLYALQSLDQLMERQKISVQLKSMRIADGPDMRYRGVHLDCSRHFFTIGEIKAFLDQLVALKFNRFHWHLTDDQGWRIEIKQYPKLTEIGAWRDSTIIGHYSRTPRTYDHKRYGGFYTQDEAREIVRYAAERGITVIPEIELPGHARAALAAYPELGCTGEQLPVPGLWGVFDDVFCTQPETIAFLKNVLKEIIAIFPSETIHIGGDECPKVRWDACPKCLAVREANGLHDSHELQSYVIREMEAFLRIHGRRLMGWDEILEGGLPENAEVMSWRGTEGGVAAALQHHPVVLTPTAFCYFDYYQSGHPDEPLAIGGFLPLEKVYSFQTALPELPSDIQQGYILGGQANLWTEYLPTMDAVEYSAFPRLVAMAQVLWTGSDRPPYEAFVEQLTNAYLWRLRQDGVTYSTAFLDPKIVPQSTPTGLTYRIEAPLKRVGFTVNGQTAEDVKLDRTAVPTDVQAAVVASFQGQALRTTDYAFTTHRLIGVPVQFTTEPNAKFNHNGNLALTDGVRGKRPWKGDQWLGFSEDTVQFTIDLGKETAFHTIELGCLNDPGSWIYQPKTIVIETSSDGRHYKKGKPQAIISEQIRVTQKGTARFIRVTVINVAEIPAGLPGAGNVPWTFIDEFILQ